MDKDGIFSIIISTKQYKMKQTPIIIVLLFLSCNLLSQSLKGYRTSFSSYFQTIVDNRVVKILHMPMCVTVSDVDVVVTVTMADGSQTLICEHNIELKPNVNCFKSYLNGTEVTYYPKENKLIINSQGVESVYYGEIPKMIDITK